MTMDNNQHGSAHFHFRCQGKPGTVFIDNEGPDAPNDRRPAQRPRCVERQGYRRPI